MANKEQGLRAQMEMVDFFTLFSLILVQNHKAENFIELAKYFINEHTWGREYCMYSIYLWMMDIQNPWESVEFCRRVVVWLVHYMWLMPRVKSGSSWCPAASDQSLVAFGSVSLPSNLSQHAVRAVMSSIHHTSDRWSTNRISARPSVSALTIK